MNNRLSAVSLLMAALGMGVLVPFLYFGIQLIAAPFYPGYSFLDRDASTLGSEGSKFPAIFNLGSILMGIMTLFASWGFFRGLRDLGVSPTLTWLTSLALASFGLASINAGVFPLPDPRHTTGGLALVGIGSILLPFLMPAALWRLHDSRSLKIYFLFNITLLILLIPIMSGLIQFIMVKAGNESPRYQSFLNHFHGLLQRILAFITISPIGIGAYSLATRFGGAGGGMELR
jgi:hypothetical membrane protein